MICLMHSSTSFIHRLGSALLILLLATHCAPSTGGTIDDDGSLNNAFASIESTPWTLVSFITADGPLAIPETFTPTLKFEDGHYLFDAGCNAVSGEYELRDNVPKLVGTIAMHTMSCAGETGGEEAMVLEDAFAESLLSWSDHRMVDDEWHITYEGGELVFTHESSE